MHGKILHYQDLPSLPRLLSPDYRRGVCASRALLTLRTGTRDKYDENSSISVAGVGQVLAATSHFE